MANSSDNLTAADRLGIDTAYANATKSFDEGGVPIGAALVYHPRTAASSHGDTGLLTTRTNTDSELRVLGQGHNQRVQKASPILHGETAALENAGRLKPEMYRNSTMYTTLSPCSMCTGAILLYKIPRLVIGENANFKGDEELLRARGVEVIVLDDERCYVLMSQFIKEKPGECSASPLSSRIRYLRKGLPQQDWYEDIGETVPCAHTD